MDIDFNSSTPIFQQIADGLENAILSGAFPEEGPLPSKAELAMRFKINPATALKGLQRLADEGLILKRRGLGMFVAPGAVQMIREKRQKAFRHEYVRPLLIEAQRLEMPADELRRLLNNELNAYPLQKEGQP